MRWVAAACVAVLLAGCGGGGNGSLFGSTEKPEEPNIRPTDFRQKLLTAVRNSLSDPTAIRDAALAEPVLKTNGGVERYIACLRYNAKGDDGNYAGLKEKAVFFYAGQMTQIVDANRELCGGAAYQPFPELQQLCREAVCKR